MAEGGDNSEKFVGVFPLNLKYQRNPEELVFFCNNSFGFVKIIPLKSKRQEKFHRSCQFGNNSSDFFTIFPLYLKDLINFEEITCYH